MTANLETYVHIIWSTKGRLPFLKTHAIRKSVWIKIYLIGKDKGYDMRFVNGYSDHCHCLIKIHSLQTISSIVKNLKGVSSKWINEQRIAGSIFQWQRSYKAIAVSPERYNSVLNYIKNQENHHNQKNI